MNNFYISIMKLIQFTWNQHKSIGTYAKSQKKAYSDLKWTQSV